MYKAYALLQPDSNFTMAALADQLTAAFPGVDIERSASELTLTKDDWDYHLLLESGPDVLNESEGFAGRIAGLDDDTHMRLCDRRVQVWSDTPDPFMEHFEDHFRILDILRGFTGVILVDPNEPALL